LLGYSTSADEGKGGRFVTRRARRRLGDKGACSTRQTRAPIACLALKQRESSTKTATPAIIDTPCYPVQGVVDILNPEQTGRDSCRGRIPPARVNYERILPQNGRPHAKGRRSFPPVHQGDAHMKIGTQRAIGAIVLGGLALAGGVYVQHQSGFQP
jgi:hypothetical protein